MNFERPSMDALLRSSRIVIVILTAVLLLSTWLSLPSNSIVPNNDQMQNLRVAYHLANSGVFAQDGHEKRYHKPRNWREPLPPIVLAGYIKIIEPFIGDVSLDDYSKGEYAKILKYHNIFWSILFAVAVFVSVVMLCKSYLAAAITTFWADNYLANFFDTLYTEISGTGLLVLSSLLLSLAVKNGKPAYFIAAGASFAALALTKAAFLYLFLVIVVGLIGYWLLCKRWAPDRLSTKDFGRYIAVFTISFAVLVSPWLVRNYVHFGKVQITERSGFILLARALYNQMSWQEYRGAVWYWAHPPSVKKYLGKQLGYTRRDLDEGGRLQRLNRGAGSSFALSDKTAVLEGKPEDAVNYWQASRAWYRKFKNEAQVRGEKFPTNIGQSESKSFAFKLIIADPLKHLAMTPLFLWRSGIYASLVFVVFIGIGLILRRDAMTIYAIPSFLSLMLYANVSHNIPRYSYSADVVAGICIAVLAVLLIRWLAVQSGFGLPWQGKRR